MRTKQTSVYSLLLLSIMFLSFNCSNANDEKKNDHIYVASWNLENLFDTVDDPEKKDEDFLPGGKKEWTESKLSSKIENLAKLIDSMNGGSGPDLLGVQEVEHERLLSSVIDKLKSKKNYKIVYEESLDKRGIDNGLIYNSEIFSFISKKVYEVDLEGERPTRYVLEAEFELNNSDTVFVYVNHWPSRGGGQEKSEPKRIKAAETLREAIASANERVGEAYVIALGDFNDEPNNISVKEILNANYFNDSLVTEDIKTEALYNLSYHEYKNGAGTYLYRGDWNMLDQVIVSGNWLFNNSIHYKKNSFEIIKPGFSVTKEGRYKGASIPTFGGRKYLGGYSDHFSVGITLIRDK